MNVLRCRSRPRAGASAIPGRFGLALLPLIVGTPLLRGAAAERATNAPPPAPALTVAVDPRVELVSTIFHLAGNPEYSRCMVASYAKDIETHFADAREHPVVRLARTLRSSRGVSYDAPMSLAVHLKDTESLALRVPLEPWPDGIDRRWRADELREFLAQAKDFAEKAKFKEFLAAHAALYAETTRRAQKLAAEEGHLDWFGNFFGERPGAQFHLVPALVNGPNCYGPHYRVGADEEFYCVLGVWATDRRGQPVFGRQVMDTVAHEFCHSYVNPHIYSRAAELRPAGQKLYAKVQGQMRRQAYGNWETMLHESVVRAAVVRYLAATQNPEQATRRARDDVGRGFLWLEELAALLGVYEADRRTYPTFNEFMPRIVAFFKTTADRLSAGGGQRPSPPSNEP